MELRNSAEGGTVGDQVTTGNSGGASGAAWDAVDAPSSFSDIVNGYPASGGYLKYDSGASGGNICYAANAPTNGQSGGSHARWTTTLTDTTTGDYPSRLGGHVAIKLPTQGVKDPGYSYNPAGGSCTGGQGAVAEYVRLNTNTNSIYIATFDRYSNANPGTPYGLYLGAGDWSIAPPLNSQAFGPMAAGAWVTLYFDFDLPGRTGYVKVVLPDGSVSLEASQTGINYNVGSGTPTLFLAAIFGGGITGNDNRPPCAGNTVAANNIYWFDDVYLNTNGLPHITYAPPADPGCDTILDLVAGYADAVQRPVQVTSEHAMTVLAAGAGTPNGYSVWPGDASGRVYVPTGAAWAAADPGNTTTSTDAYGSAGTGDLGAQPTTTSDSGGASTADAQGDSGATPVTGGSAGSSSTTSSDAVLGDGNG